MKNRLSVCLLVLLATFAAVALAQPAADEISSLPNLAGTLWPQWSGYIVVNSTNGRALHYWFVQSSLSNYQDAPVVLWLNGGPGCSSLDGFLYENGPYSWAGDENNLTLVDNPNGWNNAANMLYLEAPAGVGFSYSNTSSDYATNDWQTANDNFNALVWFFENFPEFADNDFFIAGESYAGVYVPTLAKTVAENVAGTFPSSVNFKGILVGNGVTDPYFDSPLVAEVPFVAGHGLIGPLNLTQIMQACYPDNTTASCINAVNNVYNVFDDIDIYNIIGDCFSQRSFDLQARWEAAAGSASGSNINGPGLIPPCTDAYKATVWLNTPAVKSAIHVRQDITWGLCSLDINSNYTSNAGSMLPIYQELIKYNKEILIYSGDVDGAVPFVGTEAWTSSLMGGAENALTYWTAWQVTDAAGPQVGGFKTEYETLTFITIRGAGHMVPQYQPVAAFHFFNAFINGQPI